MAGRAKDNARRHGVRAAPSSDDMGAHLTRILGRAPLPGELDAPTPRLAAALRLADCEARLDRAHAHYAAAQPRDRHGDLDHLQEILEDLLYFDWVEDGAKREAAARIMRLEHFSKFYARHDRRLAGRYFGEAQSARDRALEDYLGLGGALFPKQAKNRA